MGEVLTASAAPSKWLQAAQPNVVYNAFEMETDPLSSASLS